LNAHYKCVALLTRIFHAKSQFKEQAHADAAIEALNGQEVDGREIRVSVQVSSSLPATCMI
jgi:hypothetical protein